MHAYIHTYIFIHTCMHRYMQICLEKFLQDRAQQLPTPRKTICPKSGWWGPCAKIRVKLARRDFRVQDGFGLSVWGSWGFRSDARSLAEILDQVVQGVLKAAGLDVDLTCRAEKICSDLKLAVHALSLGST